MSYKKQKGKKEIAFKTKHVLITTLLIILIVILIGGGGIVVYNYKGKINMLNAISEKNMANKGKDISSCSGDMNCINKIVAQEASQTQDSTPEICKSIKSEEERQACEDQYYKEQAVNTRNYTLCENIVKTNTRDFCYYTVYTLTQNEEICNYIATDAYKQLCQSS